MKQFEITKNESGQRLDKYLHKRLPEATSGFLYKMLRKKNITLNDKKATGAEHLAIGDCVKIFFSDDTFEKFQAKDTKILDLSDIRIQRMPLQILYEDEDILIVNKPAGMLSQKAKPDDVSANEYILQYLLESRSLSKEDVQTFRPSVCNRLDRNTSGILIAGKTLSGLQDMSRQLKERSIQKYYRCIVSGVIQTDGHQRGWLSKNHSTNQVEIFEKPMRDGQYIETSYVPMKQYPDFTLLEVHLITGRSHQIRAHLALEGHPVVGDPKYGNPDLNHTLRKQTGLKYQLLHAHRVVLENGTEVVAPLPNMFQKVQEVIAEAPLSTIKTKSKT